MKKAENKMEDEDEEGEKAEGKAVENGEENEGENENVLQTESVDVEDAQKSPSTEDNTQQQQQQQDQEQHEYDDDEESSEITSFLKSFDIDTKTKEITTITSRHPNTVKRYFEKFVPTTISYELFWARYFYRRNEFRASIPSTMYVIPLFICALGKALEETQKTSCVRVVVISRRRYFASLFCAVDTLGNRGAVELW
mmetsp:Transcript_22199/g.29301  ORF Transcript_22199/g.29301 Transcript_22199/m.29301 type:complete len:197 (+) Transcript_22199:3406-3996(+)